MNETANRNRMTAETIRSQITRGVAMRIGARDWMHDGGALLFRVGPNSNRKCKITLGADDLYTVELFEAKGTLARGTFRIEITFTEGGDGHGVYFDMLGDSLLRMERVWAN